MIQLISKIKNNKYFFFTWLSCLSILVWYLNFQLKQNIFLYVICFIFYCFLNSYWLGLILKKNGFEREFHFPLGFFCLLFLIAFLTSIPIVLYKIIPIYLFIILLFLTIAISFESKRLNNTKEKHNKTLESKIIPNKFSFKIPKWFYFLGIIIFIFLFFLLFRSRTGEYIRSPWAVIHPLYLYGWLAMSFAIIYLIFLKCRLKAFLLVIIFCSLLLHAYLLVPYEAGFGGDKWRHIGAERSLMEGEVYKPVLFGDNISYKDFGILRVPEVLVAGNKTSYANMWGLTISLSWLTGLDVFWVDLFLGALLFSLFLPFLILKLASLFSREKTFLYLIIFLPFLFYPFQAYGSITTPLSFAFLPFLFCLILLTRYLKGLVSARHFFISLLFLIPFLYFSYILYLIAFLIMFFLALILEKVFSKKQKNNTKKWILILVIFILFSSILIPILDTHNQYSYFRKPIFSFSNISKAFKIFPVNLLFSSDAIFPRIYQFEQDSWLYSQTSQELSRSIFLRLISWWMFLTPIIFLIIILGFFKYCKTKNKMLVFWLFLSLIIFLINQMIASSFMGGNHIFSKRLVFLISFLMLFFLALGLTFLSSHSSKIIIGIMIIFLCVTFITTYASGPKFQVVTADELNAAKYIWKEYQENNESFLSSPCVLANTWPLLALEGVSGRQIIAGGFPYYVEYSQPERVQLFANMNNSPSVRYLNKAIEITDAKECYFMTENRWIFFDKRTEIIESLDKVLGEHKNIGKVMIWLYRPQFQSYDKFEI